MDTHDRSSPHCANKSALEKHVNDLEALGRMEDNNQDVEVHMCTTLRQAKTLQDMHGNTNVVAHSSQDGWVALVDSGCTGLLFKDKTKFVELDTDAPVRRVRVANGQCTHSEGRGVVELKMKTTKGEAFTLRLEDALWVPDVTQDLLSMDKAVLQLAKQGHCKPSFQWRP